MNKKIVYVIMAVLLLLILFENLNRPEIDSGKKAAYANELRNLTNWIANKTSENDVFLTYWELGTIINGYANRKTVASSKVYPSEAMMTAERYKDISRFFLSYTEANSLNYIRKYNVSYVVVKTDLGLGMCRYINLCGPQNYFSSFNITGSPKIIETSMIGRFLNNQNLSYFNEVYSSSHFRVYKFNRNPEIIYEEKVTLDSGYYKFKTAIEKSFNESAPIKHKNAKGLVVPHAMAYTHKQMANAFNSLEGNYASIIIIGPDHDSFSSLYAVSSPKNWTTPFGPLIADTEKIKMLGLRENYYAIVRDWSIRAELPFIKFKFPNARIVPVLIKNEDGNEKYIELGKMIAHISDSSTLIVLSLDFSHLDGPEDKKNNYVYDNKTFEILKNLDMQKIPEIEAEAKPPIYVFLSAMEYLNSSKVQLIDISNYIDNDSKRGVGLISAVYAK